MHFTLQTANVKADAKNSFYPNRAKVTDAGSLQQAATWDHVCAQYRNNHRGNEDFIRSDVVVMDLDNDHSEDPGQWITAEKLDEMFPNTCYALALSRHHMLPKNGKAPRPKYHAYFPVEEITDAGQYAAVKVALFKKYPFFDGKALDAARFIFGSDREGIVWHDGWLFITEDLEEEDDCDDISPLIPEGGRNNAVFHKAVSLLKRYGISDDSKTRFLEEANRCNPPLEKEELKTIWHSAKKYYRKIAAQPDYVKPDAYNGKVREEVQWEEPIPFGKYRRALFPVEALPAPVAAYVSAVMVDTQTAPDMAGTVALSVISACMQGKFRIQGKPTWIEPVNLYSLVIAPSSERKSSVLKVMIRPMNEYEQEHNKGIGVRMEANRMQKRILDRRQKMVEDLILKGKADARERDRIAAEIDAFEEVKPLKLYVDDITTEKLVKVMSENRGRAAMISSEAGIFDVLAGIYTKSVNIDVMLKGYSGDPIRVERVGREGECITDPSLTVLLIGGEKVRYYRVGKVWNGSGCDGQIGAFVSLENAIDAANRIGGVTVYDWDGRVMYVAPEKASKGAGMTQASDFAGLTEKERALKALELIHQVDDSGILPSVTAAQWVLESGCCTTDLARQAQNCFGMKCELSGNNWKSVWDGSSRYGKLTEEQDRQGNSYRVWAEFRKYPCIEDSIRDHSLYLLGAKNGSRMRYAGLTKAKDYRSAIRIIKDGGYATDVRYVDKICDIIRRYGLDRYDREKVVPAEEAVGISAEQGKEAVAENAPVAPDGAQEAAGQKLYVVQAGAFDVKGNARKRLREVRKLGGEFKKAFMVKSGGRYLVQTGEFEDEGNAWRMAKKLEGHGIEAVVKVR